MSDEIHAVRAISWRDVCPWILIFRTVRLALRLPLLFVATVALLLTPIGWWLSGQMWQPETTQGTAFAAFVEQSQVFLPSYTGGQPLRLLDAQGGWLDQLFWTSGPLPATYRWFIEPYRWFCGGEPTTRKTAYLICGCLWTLLVWSLAAGLLTRVAVVELGREERLGLSQAWPLVRSRWLSYLASPFFPLLGAAALAIPLVVLGLLTRLSVGTLLAGLVWPLALVAGLLMAMLVVGVVAGWPLMVVTISSEETGDVFEATSRSFSYLYQRPLQYLLYAWLAVVLGALGWLVVAGIIELALTLSHHAAMMGAGRLRAGELAYAAQSTPSDGLTGFGVALMQLFDGLLRTVAVAFSYSYFWCAASATYLLLRLATDHTELDEVYVPEEERRYELPPLVSTEAGVPELGQRPDEAAGASGRESE